MNCPKCGEQLPNNALFCKKCGAALAEPAAPAAVSKVTEAEPSGKGTAAAVIASVTAAVLCIGGAALYFGLRSADKDDSRPDSRPNTVKIYDEQPAPESDTSEPPADTTTTTTTTTAPAEKPTETSTTTAETTKQAPTEAPPAYNGEAFMRSANIVNSGELDYDGQAWYTGGDGLWRIDTDGHRTQLCDGTVYYINAEDGRLYFTRSDAICSMNTDGSDYTVILNSLVHELTYYKGRLYFCSQLGGGGYYICSMLPDGSDLKKLTRCLEWYMNIGGDTIYFTDYPNGRNIKAMDLDGGSLRTVCTDECYDLCLVGDKLYYSRGAVRTLCMLDLSTSAITELGGHAQYTNFYLGKLWYVDGFGNIASRSLDGTGTRTEFAGKGFSYLMFTPGRLCFCDSKNNNALREIELVQQAP